MTFKSFGIIGYGHFGQFLAKSFVHRGDVVVFDIDPAAMPLSANGVRPGTLADAAQSDVVIVAVPFAALDSVLSELEGHVTSETVIMDVVSTKARATAMLQSRLGTHEQWLATHPLFGPPSMERIERGQRLVVTQAEGDRALAFVNYLENELGLEILRIGSDRHDEAMAYMQALPFFIARALDRLQILELPDSDILGLPSFQKLATIAEIEEHHTPAMFETSQKSNPYAARVRTEFLETLMELHEELHVAETSDPLPFRSPTGDLIVPAAGRGSD